MLVVPGPVMTRAKPASAASTSASPVSTSRGRPPRSMSFCSGATTSERVVADRADHPRGELLVATAEQEALPADHRDDGRGRAATDLVEELRLRGAGSYDPAVEHDVDAERALRHAEHLGELRHRAAGPEEVADARLHGGCRCAGGSTDGRLLAGGGRRLAGLGASGPVRHGEGSEEPWFDADAMELLLVDVEHLALLHGQPASALGREPCGGDATRRPGAHGEHRRVHLHARGDPEGRDVRRQGGGDVARRAVAAREEHEGRSRVREGARGRRRVGGRRRVARSVDDDRVEARAAARPPRPWHPLP